MSHTRLSALDTSFLTVETPTAHMHVGWAAVFDPPEDGARPTFEELRDHIGARLGRAPRYRQRLEGVPFGVHDPVWVDDDDFDVRHHVLDARTTNLDEIVDAAMSTPLERSRPLWECWVAPRLDDGRIGVVGKAHHSMVDGLAAVELAALLLDPEPDPPPTGGGEWLPQPAPGRAELLAQGLVDRVWEELGIGRALARVLATPGRFAQRLGAARRAATSLVNSLGTTAAAAPSLNPELSPHRHLARLARPMDDLVRVKRHFGTTINDVLLAACSGGVRRFLEQRGEPAVALRAMVPVSLRDAGEAAVLGNRISFLFIDLPTDEPDPVRRLRSVHGLTSERKDSGEAEGAELVMNAVSHAPHVVQRAMARLAASPRMFNLVVSNIPGPPEPMWMSGCRLREAYPIVPLADRHALAIGFTSLPDGVFFGLYADPKTLPEADAIAACIGDALDELLAACRGAPQHDGRPAPAGVT
jgi:diacylglycerol O-acyltransferase / wax synthase